MAVHRLRQPQAAGIPRPAVRQNRIVATQGLHRRRHRARVRHRRPVVKRVVDLRNRRPRHIHHRHRRHIRKHTARTRRAVHPATILRPIVRHHQRRRRVRLRRRPANVREITCPRSLPLPLIQRTQRIIRRHTECRRPVRHRRHIHRLTHHPNRTSITSRPNLDFINRMPLIQPARPRRKSIPRLRKRRPVRHLQLVHHHHTVEHHVNQPGIRQPEIHVLKLPLRVQQLQRHGHPTHPVPQPEHVNRRRFSNPVVRIAIRAVIHIKTNAQPVAHRLFRHRKTSIRKIRRPVKPKPVRRRIRPARHVQFEKHFNALDRLAAIQVVHRPRPRQPVQSIRQVHAASVRKTSRPQRQRTAKGATPRRHNPVIEVIRRRRCPAAQVHHLHRRRFRRHDPLRTADHHSVLHPIVRQRQRRGNKGRTTPASSRETRIPWPLPLPLVRHSRRPIVHHVEQPGISSRNPQRNRLPYNVRCQCPSRRRDAHIVNELVRVQPARPTTPRKPRSRNRLISNIQLVVNHRAVPRQIQRPSRIHTHHHIHKCVRHHRRQWHPRPRQQRPVPVHIERWRFASIIVRIAIRVVVDVKTNPQPAPRSRLPERPVRNVPTHAKRTTIRRHRRPPTQPHLEIRREPVHRIPTVKITHKKRPLQAVRVLRQLDTTAIEVAARQLNDPGTRAVAKQYRAARSSTVIKISGKTSAVSRANARHDRSRGQV